MSPRTMLDEATEPGLVEARCVVGGAGPAAALDDLATVGERGARSGVGRRLDGDPR